MLIFNIEVVIINALFAKQVGAQITVSPVTGYKDNDALFYFPAQS